MLIELEDEDENARQANTGKRNFQIKIRKNPPHPREPAIEN
jgi:hypothetical protein